MVIVFSSLSVFAQSRAEYAECMDKANTNYDMKVCTQAEYEAADKSLNAEYSSLMILLKKDTSQIGKTILDRMIKSQRAWITFRDAQCSAEAASIIGGTGETLTESLCLADMTRERAKKVREMYGSLSGI